jgi:hypothetical protein
VENLGEINQGQEKCLEQKGIGTIATLCIFYTEVAAASGENGTISRQKVG